MRRRRKFPMFQSQTIQGQLAAAINRNNCVTCKVYFSDNDFISGSHPNYADCMLFGVLKWVDIVSKYDPITHSSPTGQWFDRVSALFNGYAGNVKTVRSS